MNSELSFNNSKNIFKSSTSIWRKQSLQAFESVPNMFSLFWKHLLRLPRRGYNLVDWYLHKSRSVSLSWRNACSGINSEEHYLGSMLCTSLFRPQQFLFPHLCKCLNAIFCLAFKYCGPFLADVCVRHDCSRKCFLVYLISHTEQHVCTHANSNKMISTNVSMSRTGQFSDGSMETILLSEILVLRPS